MKRTLFTLMLLGMAGGLLSGCTPDMKAKVDRRALLDMSEGPKVASMEDAVQNHAVEAEQKGDYKRAAQLYQQLLSQGGNKAASNTHYRLRYAEALRRSDSYDEAIKNYDMIPSTAAEHTDALEGKALALIGKGEIKAGAEVLSQVMEADATRWRTINAAAVAFALKGKPEEALEYYKEAQRISKNNPTILNNMGLTYALAGNTEEAINTLKQASAGLDSKSAARMRVDLNLALVYGLEGDMAMAEQMAKPYLSEPQLHNNLGFYAYLARDPALAKSYLNMALSESRKHYEKAWNNLHKVEKVGRGSMRAQPRHNKNS